MQRRQHFPQEICWSASFSPDISGEHSGRAAISHEFLSKKLVTVKLCLLQRMPGLGRLRPSTPAGLVAVFLFAGVLHRENFHVASGAYSTISVFSFSK